MPQPSTTNDLFDLAVTMEKSAEDLYRRFARMFSSEPDVAKFWSRFADEERGHANYLERVRGTLPSEVLAAPGDAAMLEAAQRGLANSVDSIVNHVKNLDDAYQIAVELENAETNAVFDFILVNFPTEELAKSQAFLRVQLGRHVAAIENELPARFKSTMLRREILVVA